MRATTATKQFSNTANVPRLEEFMAAEGIENRAELARRMGVHKSTVTRLMNGESGFGRAVFAGLHRAFPGRSIEQIFTH